MAGFHNRESSKRRMLSVAVDKVRRFASSTNKWTYVEKFFLAPVRRIMPGLGHRAGSPTYDDRVRAERAHYSDALEVNDLPPIFHYWSNRHLGPLLAEFGVERIEDWFALPFVECIATQTGSHAVFASIGAGNCDTEVRIAKRMKDLGAEHFTLECLDLNVDMLARGKALAEAEGVAEHLRFTETDLNAWRPVRAYAGIMANQSLHHLVNLENLFDQIRIAMYAGGLFVVSDMIGRNGHMRWPEAITPLQEFWGELPDRYRYNLQLRRQEEMFEDWDCSNEGFEGIRAQDILPLLLERFHFHKYVGFGNIIDVFVDRSFGHHFDAGLPWDRDFIDRVHACDERGFAEGALTPTHMFAVLSMEPSPSPRHARGLTPEASVRNVSGLRADSARVARHSHR